MCTLRNNSNSAQNTTLLWQLKSEPPLKVCAHCPPLCSSVSWFNASCFYTQREYAYVSTMFFCWCLYKKIVCYVSQTQYDIFLFLKSSVWKSLSYISTILDRTCHLESHAACQQRGMWVLDGPGTMRPCYCIQRVLFGIVLNTLHTN